MVHTANGIETTLILFSILAACSPLRYVDFDDASSYCKSTRQIVNIESKMIPTDETLEQQFKTDESVAPPSADDNADMKLLRTGETFVTVPNGRFFVANVDEGIDLVYWIHFVSTDPNVLDLIASDSERIYYRVNRIIKAVYEKGLFQTNYWESVLNRRILDELTRDDALKKLTNVVIHVGC
ncbi:MAG: hypothetical protein JXR76_05625 [Deltaproteobacteria bacterium]|nr:hypothetical protein [Deltaproteobacteria bacterium]